MAGSLPFTEGSGLAETWTQKGNSASQETAKGEAAEMRLWAQDCRKASRVSGCGCDAVRDQSKTGQGPVTTTPPGADESRTNIHSNSPPKVGDPHSERFAWAKELIRRANYGWPEGGGP